MTRHHPFARTASLTIAVALSLISLCSCLSAQELWGGASFGMSLKAVAAVVKNARPPEQQSTLGNHAVELLRVADAEFAGEAFTARFFFLDDALVQVMLTRDLESPFNYLAPELKKVEDEFTRVYGQPSSSLYNGDGVSPIVQKIWHVKNRKMTTLLVATGVGRKRSLLNVVFQIQPKP